MPSKADAAVASSTLSSETELCLIIAEFDGSDLWSAGTMKHFKTISGSTETSWYGLECATANIYEHHPSKITIKTDIKANYHPFEIIKTTKSSNWES